jgi:threonyl-tRNA synthetase
MIRNAEKEKIPVVGVVGANEVENSTISIRTRIAGELGAMSVDAVVTRMVDSIANFSDF